jgi:hypothetical protein
MTRRSGRVADQGKLTTRESVRKVAARRTIAKPAASSSSVKGKGRGRPAKVKCATGASVKKMAPVFTSPF